MRIFRVSCIVFAQASTCQHLILTVVTFMHILVVQYYISCILSLNASYIHTVFPIILISSSCHPCNVFILPQTSTCFSSSYSQSMSFTSSCDQCPSLLLPRFFPIIRSYPLFLPIISPLHVYFPPTLNPVLRFRFWRQCGEACCAKSGHLVRA